MEKEFIIKIDLEKLTKDIIEKETYAEGYSGYSIIENRVKDEIKQNIRNSVVLEITNSLNLNEFKESGYTKDYLKSKSNEILEENLSNLVKEKTENWIKNNIRWVIEKQAEKSVEEFLLPRLQKIINNLIVVNTEAVENEMEALKSDYENQIKQIENIK